MVKGVRIWSYFGPYFPAFGLSSERYEMRENTDQNNSKYEHLLRSVLHHVCDVPMTKTCVGQSELIHVRAQNFVPVDNFNTNNKNDSSNKLIIVKKSR